MNDALAPYTFSVRAIGDEWYASDGKLRMIRVTDGVVIQGGATELAEPAAGIAAGGAGPARVVKPALAAMRFRPY